MDIGRIYLRVREAVVLAGNGNASPARRLYRVLKTGLAKADAQTDRGKIYLPASAR